MPSTTINTVEKFVVEGPFGLSVAIAIGLVIALLFAWTLRRESSILGTPTTVLFWCLRTLAMSVALWMLLAPTRLLTETSSTRRSVVIATDVSGSMQTIDPPGTSDDLRWALAGNADTFSTTRNADEAVAALGIAQHQIKFAREALQQHRQERPIIDAITAANEAIESSKEHLHRIDNAPSDRRPSERSQALVNRLIKMLESAEVQSFSQLAFAIKKNRTSAQKGWQEGLPDLDHRISVIKSLAQELATSAAEDEATGLTSENSRVQSSLRNTSRSGRVLKSVQSLQTGSLAAVQETADVRFGSFDQAVHWLSNPPAPNDANVASLQPETGVVPGTDLSNVLAALHKESTRQPIAAVFLFSDVAHNQHSDKNPREVAKTLTETPVYVLPIGNTQHVRDVRLRSVSAPTVAMRNDDIVIVANLQAFECEDEVCVVQLFQNEKPIDQREIDLDSGLANRTVRFERRVATLGTERFRVAIVPIEGELTTDNNHQDFEVNVTRSDIKILIADEFPRWEYRYLTQLFRRDRTVECDELLFHPRMIATGRREETKSFPTTVDDWDQYDLVLLGDVPVEHLPVAAQEALVAYLQDRGGTLVMIAGPQSMPQAYEGMPLGEILPVAAVDQTDSAVDEKLCFRITAEGRDHPALMIGETEEENRVAWDFVNQYSPLPSVSLWRKSKAAARVLIAASPVDSKDPAKDEKNSVFLCWQPIGQGRIVYLSGPESFRMRFLRGDRLHYRFWGQLLRWAIATDLAAGTKFVKIRTDKSRYDTDETVMVTVRLADGNGQPLVVDGVSAKITGPDQARVVSLSADLLVPGEYRGEIRSLTPGDYQVEPGGTAVEQLQQENAAEPASASFTVQNELSTEMTETRCDRALAQQIADVTGGQVVPPTAIDQILKLTNLEPITSTTIQQQPLWVQWRYLWIVFGCLQCEWFIRRRFGLS